MKNFILSLWYKYKSWRWEQHCIKYFGSKPETIYVSIEDYDKLVEQLNKPSDPEKVAKLREIMNRKLPWECKENA